MTYWLIGLGIIVVLYFIFLAWTSQTPPELGFVDEKLRPCPDTPNCVCSEFTEQTYYIAPIQVPPDMTNSALETARDKMEQVLRNLGGEIQQVDTQYIWATFTTPLFRYVDDVEVRFSEEGRIHVRSASRVGRSDFGQNKKRIEALRTQFAQ